MCMMGLGRGITIYKGERGFLKESFDVSQPCDIVFTVVTRLELRRLKNMVAEIDPKAFVFTSIIKEAAGGVLKRRKALIGLLTCITSFYNLPSPG